MPIEEGNIEHNLDTMAAMLDKAVNSDQRPDAVLLPELWNTGFYPKPISEYADSQDIWKKHMGRLASEYTVNIIAGSIAVARKGKIYNTCYVFDRTGANIATYEKTHLFSPAGENADFTPGSRLTTFSIDGIQHWDTLLRARAIENQFFVVAANGISSHLGETMHLGGGSAIYDPWGSLLAQGSTDNLDGEILHANLQPGMISQIRSDISIFKDRRPELYRLTE